MTCTHILATLECLWFWGLPSHISCWPDGVGGCQKLPTVWHFASGTHLPFFSTPKWPQNDPNFWLVILETICSSGKKIWATFISQKMTKIASEDWAYYIRKMKIWHSTVYDITKHFTSTQYKKGILEKEIYKTWNIWCGLTIFRATCLIPSLV